MAAIAAFTVGWLPTPWMCIAWVGTLSLLLLFVSYPGGTPVVTLAATQDASGMHRLHAVVVWCGQPQHLLRYAQAGVWQRLCVDWGDAAAVVRFVCLAAAGRGGKDVMYDQAGVCCAR